MSSGFTIISTEVRDLARDLAAAAGAIGPVATSVQREYGQKIVARAKQLAPVRTGALQRSIRIAGGSRESSRLGLSEVVIEADTTPETGRSYAGYVEFGTSRMAPRPFLRPALREYAKDYREALVEAGAELLGSANAARRGLRGRSLFRGPGSLSLGSALGRIRR